MAHYGHGPEDPCLGLFKNNGRYGCKIFGLYRKELAGGAGCSSVLNSDRVAMVRKIREAEKRRNAQKRRAKK